MATDRHAHMLLDAGVTVGLTSAFGMSVKRKSRVILGIRRNMHRLIGSDVNGVKALNEE